MSAVFKSAANDTFRNVRLLASCCLFSVGIAVYSTWPAQHLIQEAPPKLPSYEDCPRDFDDCFARVLRKRIRMAEQRDDFCDAYGARVSLHLAKGAGLFLILSGAYWYLRSPRKINQQIRSFF